MANISSLLSCAIIYIIHLGLGDCGQLSEEECRSLGFTPNLMCTSCNLLDEYNLAALKDDCRKCCQEDSGSDSALKAGDMASHTLSAKNIAQDEVEGDISCRRAFVKSDKPQQFPGLEIKYVRGADPEIHLMDDNRDVHETLGIEKWNTDSVEQFFHERLRK